MQNKLTSFRPRITVIVTKILLGFILATATVTLIHAQGQIASGTVSGTGAGPYSYSLSFSDDPAATHAIGSVWYAWVPGSFFLPGSPTSATAPAGWTAHVVNNSVQFVASSSAQDILAGQTLSGFGYQAAFSPAQLAAAPNSGLSVAYGGGLFSDSGNTFSVQLTPVPEPSSGALLAGVAATAWVVRRRASRN